MQLLAVECARPGMSLKLAAIFIALSAAVGIVGYFYFGNPEDTGGGAPIALVSVPEVFSEQAQFGRKTYEANCAACHGQNAAGQDGIGPPLVHVYYEPGHHSDELFQRAVAQGVQAHHWRFGDMAPVAGLTRSDVAEIIAYVRELQRANGIL